MAMEYFRRSRMEINFAKVRLSTPVLPEGYRCIPWNKSFLERHAMVKYLSFRDEIDSRVFHCLGELVGCRRLMSEIAGQKMFLPGATWLIMHQPDNGDVPVDCGTIQGLTHSKSLGAIQNVGIIPDHRGLGLGRALLLYSLAGFQRTGLKRVYLEVTAENHAAVELYRSIGFRLTRTLYKAVEAEVAHAY